MSELVHLSDQAKRELLGGLHSKTIALKRQAEARRMEWILSGEVEVVEPQRDSIQWPDRHVQDIQGLPVPFHQGQALAWDSTHRITAMIAGSQGGKTVFGAWWLNRLINRNGGGEYLAVTATYDMFKLKMLPSMIFTFVDVLGIGRYWPSAKVMEIANPATGEFEAGHANDLGHMWAKIILRSADAKGGLESATARGAWLDEAGQDRFGWDAYKAIRRRMGTTEGEILITTTLYYLGWLTRLIVDRASQAEDAVTRKEVFTNNGMEAELSLTDSKSTNIRLIQYDSIVNPAYSIKEFKEAEETLRDDEFQMLFKGRKGKLRQLVLSSFIYSRHTSPRFPIPKEWDRFLGIDFGGTNMAAMFYALNPKTKKLFAYREYHEGGLSIKQHVERMLKGERKFKMIVGGSLSEDQWRRDFATHGMKISEPAFKEVDIGVARVFAAHRQNAVIYFRDLDGILDEKGRYKYKLNKDGELTREIENKSSFHRQDGERYLFTRLMKATAGEKAKLRQTVEEMQGKEEYKDPWRY